jgi:hypothetical protein
LLPDVAAPDTETTMPSTSTDIAAIHFQPGLIEAPSRSLPGDLLTGFGEQLRARACEISVEPVNVL